MTAETPKPVIFLAFANEQQYPGGYLRKLGQEIQQLQEILEGAARQGLCQVVIRPNATIEGILGVFRAYRDRVAIFHFGGHADSYHLLLESLAGKTELAHARGLAAFLGGQAGLHLVFLNACATQGHVQALLGANVSSVIATSRAIDDQVATDFAIQFYRGLASGARLSTAYHEAASVVQMKKGGAMRALYWGGEAAEAGRVEDRFPWELYPRELPEAVAAWNLPEAAGDPLFGLPPPPEMDLPESPFRHLHWFTREHAGVFFGRGYQVRELYDRVTAVGSAPIILFYGQSGVGKSSLLAAGLLPRLEAGHAARYLRKDQERGLLGALEAALLPEAAGANGHSPLPQAWLGLEEELGKPLVVILDQVEEVYTRPQADPSREWADLLAALQAIFADPGRRPRGRLILSFRKEWLAEIKKQVADHKLYHSQVFLERLDRRGVIEAVNGPAGSERLRAQYGLSVEPELAGIIADDLLEDRDSPVAPTLQILLTKMWQAARGRNYARPSFDLALYQELKRQGILLGDFLDQGLESLKAWRPELVESGLALDVLAYHTTAQGTAEQRRAEDLRRIYRHRHEDLRPLMQHCQDVYLLVDPSQVAGPSQGQAEEVKATRLAHDTLAPLVRRRFDESHRPGQLARRVLENRAVEWNDGVEGTPLDERDLALVESGAPGMRAPTQDETRLILASRAERERRERKRRFWRAMGVVAVLLIAVAAIVAGWQWRVSQTSLENEKQALADAEQARFKAEERRLEAEEARAESEERRVEADAARAEAEQQAREARLALSGQLALKAQAEFAQAPERALLLAVEALNTHLRVGERHNPAAEEVLRQVLADARSLNLDGGEKASARGLIVLSGYAAAFPSATPEASGNRWLVTRDDDNTIWVWDWTAEDPAADPIALYSTEDDLSRVALSPDGRWLAASSGYPLGADRGDPSIQLWDLTAEDPSARRIVLRGHEGGIFELAFIPGSSRGTGSRWLVTTSWDNTARLWDLAEEDPSTGSLVLRGHEDPIQDLAFSLDGHWLVTGSQDPWISSSGDTSARVWDLTAQDPTANPLVLRDESGIYPYALSAAASQGTGVHWLISRDARLWDLTAEGPLIEAVVLGGDQDQHVCDISFDHRWLATCIYNESDVNLWDLSTSDPTAVPLVFPGREGPISVVDISPDNHWLFASASNNTGRLWDLSATNPVEASILLRDVGYNVSGEGAVAAFLGNRWLFTNGAGANAHLWDLATPDVAAAPIILSGPEGERANAIGISPDGHWLATSSGHDSTCLWTLVIDELVEGACDAAGRNLTWEEWAMYFPGQPYRKICPNLPIHPSFIEHGRGLARAGDIEGAVAHFRDALALDPGLELDPEMEALRVAAETLVTKGKGLAEEGNIQGAIAEFEAALNLDSSLDLDPETEARQVAAQALVGQGVSRAAEGDLEGALAYFREALDLDPSLDLDPQQEARRFVAQALIRRGRERATNAGDIEAAVADFREALDLDPSLDLDPETEASRLSAYYLVEQGRHMFREGRVDGALANFEEAVERNPDLANSVLYWDQLCWYGSLAGRAADVLGACDKAVELAARQHNRRLSGLDSRGIARALVGDTEGAVADFRSCIDWMENEAEEPPIPGSAEGLQDWITALEAGENPFTPDLIEILLRQ